VQVGHIFDVHFIMRIVNDELSYKGNKKSNGYNVIEGEKILKTEFIEGITSRQGKKLSKKKMERLLKIMEEKRVTVINNSVTVQWYLNDKPWWSSILNTTYQGQRMGLMK